jgi:hypothetical protein
VLENEWRDKKVIPRLDKMVKRGLPVYWFIKEAKSVRGIPDLIICANGHFVAWELKPTKDEAEKTTGRIALQKYTLTRIQRAHGTAEIVHPENLEEHLSRLEVLCSPIPWAQTFASSLSSEI